MSRFSSADGVYEYLNRFLNFERKLEPTEYRLDRMRALHELHGRPDRAFRVVHVAGSKGKGSTSAMIASVIGRSHGPVGLFTSPHLLSFTERIMVDGRPVDTAILCACAERLAAAMDGLGPEDFPGGENPTYFELLTLLGFLCFREAGCAWAVIEVGLGGRLDSTNVVEPEACVITPIELEHTELLGNTIAAIAGEKAGIMKPGVPVFTSATRPEALAVFRETAARLGSPLTVLGEAALLSELSIGREGTSVTVRFGKPVGGCGEIRLRTPMIGAVQAQNAALAAMTTLSLGFTEADTIAGIARAVLRARFEIVPSMPPVVLDGAHTADSIRACADDFRRIFPGGGLLLFGCAKDKNPAAMAAELAVSFDRVLITRPGTFKESDPPAMARAFTEAGMAVELLEDTAEAIAAARSRSRETGLPLLVTGSFYLCAEAARLLEKDSSGS